MNNIRRFYFFCLVSFTGMSPIFSQKWDSIPGPFQGTGGISSMCADSTYLYVGGAFNKLQGIHTQGIARWNGIKWDSMGAGIDRLIQYDTGNHYPENIYAMAIYHHKLYVGGKFWSVGYLISQGIGVWNDTAWDSIPVQPFKKSYFATSEDVAALAVINNKLYMGGDFDTVAGKPCIGIACWNDINWSSLNFPNLSLFSYIDAICEYKGSIYVGGLFDGSINGTADNIARWDSTGWHQVGQAGIPGSLSDVWCMAVYNGELYVGGEFSTSDGNVGNNIEKWDGTQWSDVGGGTDYQVENMFVYNGKLYAMGNFTKAGGVSVHGIAEWDGTKWCSFAGYIDNNIISSACLYHDSLYIGGNFAINDTIAALAEWVGGDYTDSCEVTTGVSEVKESNTEISVYPNPSSGIFQLEITNEKLGMNSIVQVYTMLGEKVYSNYQITKSSNYQIDLSNQPTGVYLYRIMAEDGSLVGQGKLVIEK